jgi:hypothetical protein
LVQGLHLEVLVNLVFLEFLGDLECLLILEHLDWKDLVNLVFLEDL